MTETSSDLGTAAAASATLRAEAEGALRRLVGRDDAQLRDDQWRAIEALVVRHSRALVVQRTGWGKSAVYFVATALLRARGSGPTVIISPLLALMRDQIAAATRAGVRAATVNSANVTEWDEVHAAIARGEIDVLLCSPERLNNPSFRDDVLPKLAADAGLVVVDEAHCISDWGHDFRPDYRRIRTLLEDLPAGIPVLATTATANSRVTADVAEQLSVSRHPAGSGTADGPSEVLVLRGELDRESLHLGVLSLPDPAARVAWLASSLPQLGGSGIVYCLTVSQAEEVAAQLRRAGLKVAAYTGKTDPTEREALEDDLKHNRVTALIATSALGMGFDKPDLAFVVHVGAPSSPIAYYQQVGRAGRGVDRAVVALLPGTEDQAIWDWFGSQAFPPEDQVRTTLNALATDRPTSVAALETAVDLRRGRLEAMLKVLDVDGVVRRVTGGWIATGKAWHYDTERYARVARARADEQQTMLDYQSLTTCRMAFLRQELDDPELTAQWACGRCDNCNGLTLPPAPASEAVTATRDELDRVGVEIVPRRQWPTGVDRLGVSLKGRIPAADQAKPGRAVARLDGLGWSGALRELFESRDADGRYIDGETPLPLRGAATRVLDEWDDLWGSQGLTRTLAVDAVVGVVSTTRPQLLQHLAPGLARYLQLPFSGWITPRPELHEPARHDVNSAQRLAGVAHRLVADQDAATQVDGRAVLLVDDYTDSGWTLTVAARLLTQAGATEVRPFVLGVR
ncbi:RecQ family ATP-dependent DNA helicase [Demequina sp. B12]|uniref:RecQ family ATP-dependent DNA helicase n=1 Tax=Demequina sp. B12 TaxID=2992757 RepID=UPI00237C4A97|nr:RecQ family ATP-dependent DNA helicase [Demequina sp. B12]MDE0573310.1 RecQ family ATP-dependent DNA helicase [Demequina sp. B12]